MLYNMVSLVSRWLSLDVGWSKPLKFTPTLNSVTADAIPLVRDLVSGSNPNKAATSLEKCLETHYRDYLLLHQLYNFERRLHYPFKS